MRQRILRHLRPRSAACLILGVLIGAGGSYALAAGTARTITACADKSTGAMHLRTHGRCQHTQTLVSWNQQGTPGKQGPPGAPAISIWAEVGSNAVAGAEHGLSIKHSATGTYQVTVTNAACANSVSNAPVVSVGDANPPAGYPAGAFPVAWFGESGPGHLIVFTGVAVGGAFTLSDRAFSIYDTC